LNSESIVVHIGPAVEVAAAVGIENVDVAQDIGAPVQLRPLVAVDTSALARVTRDIDVDVGAGGGIAGAEHPVTGAASATRRYLRELTGVVADPYRGWIHHEVYY
jgi:hypothetical protein